MNRNVHSSAMGKWKFTSLLRHTVTGSSRVALFCCAFSFVIGIAGCNNTPPAPEPTPPQVSKAPAAPAPPTTICQAGTTRECICENKSKGIQSCTDGGQKYGQCICIAPPPLPAPPPPPADEVPKEKKPPVVKMLEDPTEVTTKTEEAPPPHPSVGEIERVHAALPKLAERLAGNIEDGKNLAEAIRTAGGTDCPQCEKFASKISNSVDTTLGTCWGLLDRKSVGFDGYLNERKIRLIRMNGSLEAMLPTLVPDGGDDLVKEWKAFLKHALATLDAIRSARIKRYGKLPKPDLPICQ